MNLFGITSLMIFFASIGFAFFLYLSNKTSRVNRAWLYASTSIAVWGLSLYGVTSTGDISVAEKWQYLLDVSAIFIPVFYFNFISALVGTKNYTFRFCSFITATAIALFSFTTLFKTGVSLKYGFFWIDSGPYYAVFPIFFILYTIFSLYLLGSAYHKNKGNILLRAQLRNTFIAGSIGFSGGITNFFPQILDVYPFGNYFVLLYVFFMSYGVLKYKLLSAKIISAQLFSGAVVLVFLFNLLQKESLGDWIVALLLFVLVVFFSIFLVRGVYKEVETREKIEKLATDLEKTNKDLANANERLKELDQLKTEFVSLATHQIRGPLTAIRGYASLMLDGDFGHVSDALKDPLDKIMSSSKHLITTVQDFLDISRIEQGRMKYDMTTFDLRTMAEEAVGELKPNVEKAGLKITFKADKGAHYTINGDAGKLRQVVQNLIDNAQKYTKKGTITVSLTKSSDHKKVILSVHDTGVGIDAETIPKLFQKFTRAKDANKTNVLGTGLGLYVAREMIKAHNGRIWVESEGVGKGSTFFIELEAVK